MSDENKIVPIGTKKKRSRSPGQMQTRQKSEVTEDDKREKVGTALAELMVEVNQPKVMSDNQLRDRLNNYLNRCYQNKQYPTVEEGFLSTGYTRRFLMDIAEGKRRGRYFSPEAAEIIGKFLDICAAFDAKMVMQGAAPMIGYIYRSKQHYGMSDKTEVQLTSNANIEQEMNLDDIASRYRVETTFSEPTETSSETRSETSSDN